MSFRQYGGQKHLDRATNINTGVLTADNIIFKQGYLGNFDICGSIVVTGGSISVEKDLNVSGDTELQSTIVDTLTVGNVSVFNGEAIFKNGFTTTGNIAITGNLELENLSLLRSLFFDNEVKGSKTQFITGTDVGLGINIDTPQYALDIYGYTTNTFSVYTSTTYNYNVIAQNNLNYGITTEVNGIVDSKISFYLDDTIMSRNENGSISSQIGGNLRFDVSNDFIFKGSAIFSDKIQNDVDHIGNETLTIYDNNSGIFYNNVYNNSNSHYGIAATMVAQDNNSSTFINAITSNNSGAAISGGSYPIDNTRSMGSFGIYDDSINYLPTQLIVQGKDPVKYKSTLGINTFQPRTEEYVVDINGPVHIDNGDITEVVLADFEITSLSMSSLKKNIIMAVGSTIDISGSATNLSEQNIYRHAVLYSNNYGSTWNTSFTLTDTSTRLFFNSVSIYDNTYALISGDNNSLYSSIDSGLTWNNITTRFNGLTPPSVNYNNIHINNADINGNLNCFFSVDASLCFFNTSTVSISQNVRLFKSNLGYINKIDGFSNKLYICGNNIAKVDTSIAPNFSSVLLRNIDFDYKDINVFDDSFIIAVGGNIISTTRDGGTNWSDTPFAGYSFTSVFINDSNNAVAVGTYGNIWTSYNGGLNWSKISDNLLSPSGKRYILDSANQFTSVVIPEPNTILLTNTLVNYDFINSTYGKSNIINIFTPNYLNLVNNSVLDVCGNMNITGSLNIDVGKISSNNSSFDILNNNVSIVNFGGDASSINIGNLISGTTYIRNSLDVSLNSNFYGNAKILTNEQSTSSTTGALVVSGGVGIGGNINIEKNAVISGDTTILGITTLNNDTILNKNLFVSGNINVSSLESVLLISKSLNTGNISAKKIGINNSNSLYELDIIGSGNIYGNMYISNRLGIGNLNPQYNLDVTGNANISTTLNVTDNTSVKGNILVGQHIFFTNPTGVVEVNNISSRDTMTVSSLSNMNINAQTNMSISSKNIMDINTLGGVINIGKPTSETDNTIISIGSPNGQVIIRGTLSQPTFQTPLVNAPQFFLNANSKGNGVSGGAGLFFQDLSFANSPFINYKSQALIIQGADLQSFLFKAASYGTSSFNGTTPDPTGNAVLLSDQLTIKLATNSMFNKQGSLNQLVVLQPGDFYANTTGNALYPRQSSSDYESDYVITTTSLDVSNILVKETDFTRVGLNNNTYTQTILSELNIIGNISLKNAEFKGIDGVNSDAVTITGNTLINIGAGNVSSITFKGQNNNNFSQIAFYNSIVGTQYNNYFNYSSNNNSTLVLTSQRDTVGSNSDNILIRPSGIVIIDACSNSIINTGKTIIQPFGGNVGIGTLIPAFPLDVVGSQRVFGQLLNTNYDTALFEGYYSSQLNDTRQTISRSSGSHWQDAAISYSGKYMIATAYNMYGNANVYLSSDYGTTWSTSSLQMNSYNSNILQAVPYMSDNTTVFTRNSLYQNTIGAAGAVPLNIQIGQFDVSSSSISSFKFPYYGFNNNNLLWWQSDVKYITSTGIYNGDFNTTISIDTISTPYNIYGEWIQVKLPYSFIITKYQYQINSSSNTSYPRNVYLLGSNNGSTWENLLSNTNTSFLGRYVTVNLSLSKVNNTSYNYYRIVVNSIASGGTTSFTEFGNLNLIGTVPNINGSIGLSVVMSGTGQYTTVINKAYNNNFGNIHINSNFGKGVFIDTNTRANGGGTWQSIAISQSGQFQAAVIAGTVRSANIWLSSNFGGVGSWEDSLFGVPNGWISISMSSTGQYITAVQAGNITNKLGNIWSSNNYGQTWSSSQKVYSFISYDLEFLNIGLNDVDKTIAISTNGQYQTVLGLGGTSDKTSNANIWINSNFGLGAWTDTRYRAPTIIGGNSLLTSITVTGTGQYQSASFISVNNSTGVVYGNLLLSSNYGVTWRDDNKSVPYNGYYAKVASSVNGKYTLATTSYTGNIINGNLITNNINGITYGNLWLNNVFSYNNTFSTQYFGSAYNNNVFQTHGLQLNVPNDNNASVIMGYDVEYDSAYIKSEDQYGPNNLCLNPMSGTVSIGKINPNQLYALDVSGSSLLNGSTDIINGYLRVVSSIDEGAIVFGDSSSESALIYSKNIYGVVNLSVINKKYGNIFFGTNNSQDGESSLCITEKGVVCINTIIPVQSSALTINGITSSAGFNSSDITKGYTISTGGLVNSTVCAGFESTITRDVRIHGTGGNIYLRPISSTATSTQVRINNLGYVGIGISSTNPSTELTLRGVMTITNSATANATTAGGFQGLEISYNSSGTTGYASLQPSNPGSTFNTLVLCPNKANATATTSTVVIGSTTITGNYWLDVGAGNTAASVRAGTFNAVSDYRIKYNVNSLLSNDTITVDNLLPIEYDLVGGKHDMGFLAHEVQEIFPFLVTGEKDGDDIQSLNYNGFIALLVKEIQELKKDKNKLLEQNRELEIKTDSIDERLKVLESRSI